MDMQKEWMDNDAFLGVGWSFPPQITARGARMSAYEDDIRESLRVLFSTAPGERVNRYDYGRPLRQFAFEPLTPQTMERLRDAVSRAVILFEPRIVLESVTLEDRAEDGCLLIQLSYTITRTNNRNNMVYPFYINEGTSVQK